MKIEMPVVEKPSPKRIYNYKVSVNYSSDRPTLMKIIWGLDENCVMSARGNWGFKLKTVLTPVEMTRIMATYGFLCSFRRTWF